MEIKIFEGEDFEIVLQPALIKRESFDNSSQWYQDFVRSLAQGELIDFFQAVIGVDLQQFDKDEILSMAYDYYQMPKNYIIDIN